jgi:hypothetical protein
MSSGGRTRTRTAVGGTGPMKCRERLGGLLKFYNREAASPRGRIELSHTTGKRVARSLRRRASEEIVTDVRERLRALLGL